MSPVARFMPRWAVVVWWLNSRLDNRWWARLPYRFRDRWAREWVAAHQRWRDAGRPA